MVATEVLPDIGRRLLVVDDHEDVRRVIVGLMENEGYSATPAATGEEVANAVAHGSADLILLDVMLEEEDGFDVLTDIRRTSDVPVIMLTAKMTEDDRVQGLRLGADDYVTKPFSGPELAARVVSVLRRCSHTITSSSTMTFGSLSIDLTSRVVRIDGEILPTTMKEFDLLVFLASSPKQVFNRAQLLEKVWGFTPTRRNESTVTEHIRRLRNKLEGPGGQQRWIRTVRGVGYLFEP
jgi:DNA-binding response OmpR family regulator